MTTAYETAKQSINTLGRLIESGELETLNERQLKEVVTELTIIVREMSLKTAKHLDQEDMPNVAPRKPVGMLSRLAEAWSKDLDSLWDEQQTQWRSQRER